MCGTSQSKYSHLQCIDVAVRIRSGPDDGDVTYLLVVVNSGVYLYVKVGISATLPLHYVPAVISNRKQTQQYTMLQAVRNQLHILQIRTERAVAFSDSRRRE